MLATGERFLPAGTTSRIGLASENHWLQPVLVLTSHWWPTPVSVGGLLVTDEPVDTLATPDQPAETVGSGGLLLYGPGWPPPSSKGPRTKREGWLGLG